jgi:hypothetical protein
MPAVFVTGYDGKSHLPGDVMPDGTIVAGIDPVDGTSAMYVPPADQNAGTVWGCPNQDMCAQFNVVNGYWLTYSLTCNNPPSPARDVCKNLAASNYLGHNDWYLPARNELAVMMVNRTAIGNFTADNYWSSTPSNNGGGCGSTDSSWRLWFNTTMAGLMCSDDRNTGGNSAIRCARH